MTDSTPVNSVTQPDPAGSYREILQARGITTATARRYGLCRYDGVRLRELRNDYKIDHYPRLPAYATTGLLVPYPTQAEYSPTITEWDGTGATYWRVRADQREVSHETYEGVSQSSEITTIPRWFAPQGPVRPYLTWSAIAAMGDTSVPIAVAEAPLKAISIESSLAIASIGLGGVTAGYHDAAAARANAELVLHEDLRAFLWAGRTVYISYDAGLGGADDPGNPLVGLGAARLAKLLLDRGAIVRVVRLPYWHAQNSDPESGQIWQAEDQGPDDYIARNGAEEFRKLLDTSHLADPAAWIGATCDGLTGASRVRAVTRLLRDLLMQAMLSEGGKLAVAAASAEAGRAIPGAAFKAAAEEFSAKLKSKVEAEEPWTREFATNAAGTPRPCRENVELALRHDTGLKGLLAFDEFSQALVLTREPPWSDNFTASKSVKNGDPWTDEDDTRLASYLANKYGMVDLQTLKVRAAVVVMAHEQTIHPVRDYLNGVEWDTESRVESWLSDYLDVESTEYSRLVGRWWLISAVARIMEPGCQVDHTLILEGGQGAGKSSALEVLGGDWFTDADLGDLKSKESAMLLQGAWILELAEGDIFSRASTQALKAFATKRRDDIIKKFSNLRTRLPRQCVYALTINPEGAGDYLVDPTGNRRWWPVLCGSPDLDGLRASRDQLWAEAVALYRAGIKWWPDSAHEKELCAVEQEMRAAQDAWLSRVQSVVRPMVTVTVSDILSGLGISIDRQDRKESRRATNCLRALGWVELPGHGKVRRWQRGAGAEPQGVAYGHLTVVVDDDDVTLGGDQSIWDSIV